MGRIKTQLVKSVSRKLLDKHGEDFTSEFDKNKVLVSDFSDVSSKKMRNVIAGYIARLKKSGV
ncbi:30S ribosomal protein S17e [archaeon]|nr:30S ribosomal protein S17e [archaeon]MBL7057558.1 30S ribosomal protein S17e [Candidatus Woesearchaeota archaeon]